MSQEDTATAQWAPLTPTYARATSPPDRLVDEVERRLRRIALIVSAALGAWTEASQLEVVDAHVLLALSDPGRPTGATELSDGSGVSLDAIYPALHRLIGRGYVHAEDRRYSRTGAGQGFVASFELAQREGIQSYVAQISPDELLPLEAAVRSG